MPTIIQKCVYCLQHRDDITIDHVIPSAWFPDTTPPNIEKWKVPCCKKCNNQFSKIEKNQLERLGICLDPNDPRSSGIPRKASRALKPSAGKSLKDKLAREKKRNAIRKRMYDITNKSREGILPHFGPLNGVVPDNPAVVFIDSKELTAFGGKLIRSLIYFKSKQFVEREFVIDVHMIREEGSKELNDIYSQFCTPFELGPGVGGSFGFSDAPPSGLFFFHFWGKLEIHGSVIHKSSKRD